MIASAQSSSSALQDHTFYRNSAAKCTAHSRVLLKSKFGGNTQLIGLSRLPSRPVRLHDRQVKRSSTTTRAGLDDILYAVATARIPAFPALLAAGLAVYAISKSFTIVGQGDGALIERLGVYNRTLTPGLHFMIPFIEYLSTKKTLRERVLDVPPQQCITTDNAPITADAVVYFRIADLKKERYNVENLVFALQNLVLTQLRNAVGRLTLDETFSARATINTQLLNELEIATKQWGVEVTRVEVRDILPASSISNALEKQMTAERIKRAVVLESEGTREAAVNTAEGAAQSTIIDAKAQADRVILAAEAEKTQRLLLAEGLAAAVDDLAKRLDMSTSEAANLYLARDYIQANQAVATSNGAKVLFMDPNSIGGAVATLSGIATNVVASDENDESK